MTRIANDEAPCPDALSEAAESLLASLAKRPAPEPDRVETVDVRTRSSNHALELGIFAPNWREDRPTRAVALFHGGGWVAGNRQHFARQAAFLRSLGLFVVLPAYRLLKAEVTLFDIIDDAVAAVESVRTNSRRWGIDPSMIMLGGGSAGALLAVNVAHRFPPGAPCTPAGLILFNPILDVGPAGYEHHLAGDRYHEVSPIELTHRLSVPTLVMLGTHDTLVPVRVARDYRGRAQRSGSRCDLCLYEGEGHGFFNAERSSDMFVQTLRDTARFLGSIDVIGRPDGEPVTT